MDNRIIIVGAGASGLMAAITLLRKGKKVVLLEAGAQTGGRIRTLHKNGAAIFEAGAEFVHGDLPLTMGLLKQYQIPLYPVGGAMAHMEDGKPRRRNVFGGDWRLLIQKMAELQEDISFAAFLKKYFSGPAYTELRHFATGFAGGFDNADINKASTKSLFREWSGEEGAQHRIEGGHARLTDAMTKDCLDMGVELFTSEQVKKISWQKNEVRVTTASGKEFTGGKLIITVSPRVLLASQDSESGIAFSPQIPVQLKAAKEIGFGPVIKLLLQFSEPFWNLKTKKAGFILTGEAVPTWWTHYPREDGVLTGWIAGSRAIELRDKTDEMLILVGEITLASAFGFDYAYIHERLLNAAVFNWDREPYVLGAYSYATLQSGAARELLHQPLEGTIYFAGEALYDGVSQGTVEAALSNGAHIAGKI